MECNNIDGNKFTMVKIVYTLQDNLQQCYKINYHEY